MEGKSLCSCPECGGELVDLAHPEYLFAMTHLVGCSRNRGRDSDYSAALRGLFAKHQIPPDSEEHFFSGEVSVGDYMVGDTTLLVNERCSDAR